ncbi:MAG: hypothetical protein IKB02_01235 [Clostridia bacterium]|nr:hypothetical protein [Clostridia bacterium]
MREYKKNICVSDSNRLTEKAFKQSITISVIGILLCMVALCSVTWAWFSAEISSSPNDITSAYCDVTVSVKNNDTAIVPSSDGKYTFEKDTPYKITITAEGNAKTAYCVLNVDGTNYYTDQISIGESIAFTLQFGADTTEVEIIRCWGTSSVPDANRTFINGGLYLNCTKKDALPASTPETNSTKEAIESQPINNGTPVEVTTTSEVVTESDTAEAVVEVVTDISPSEITQ